MSVSIFFFFNDTATTEIYTLSLHDALPISLLRPQPLRGDHLQDIPFVVDARCTEFEGDRKSTRLNSSHTVISYAVFCLKKKKTALHACALLNFGYRLALFFCRVSMDASL